MTTLGRATLLWMIPIDLLLIVWVWIGRIVFGVGGWFLLILLVTVVPVLLVGLLITTVLAFTQGGPAAAPHAAADLGAARGVARSPRRRRLHARLR